jgi:hypothetical protein
MHRPALGTLNLVDVFGRVGVPDAAGKLQAWADEGLVGMLLGGDGVHFESASDVQTECLIIGLVGDVADPTEVVLMLV